MRPCGSNKANGGIEFQGKAIRPILFAKRQKVAALRCSRVVDDYIDRSVETQGSGQQLCGSGLQAQIQGDCARLTASVFDFMNNFVQLIFVASAEYDMRAFSGQPMCNCPAYAAAGAGYNVYL